MRRALHLGFLCAFAVAAMAEPPTIFLVRHAERADAGGAAQNDPDLSEAGRARAAALAETLRDAKISAIYVTQFRRTQETAQSLAEKLKIHPVIIPAKEGTRLLAALKNAGGNVLVVGHSNTVPEIMRALGIATAPALGERDYDDLFLVLQGQPSRLIHLHYR